MTVKAKTDDEEINDLADDYLFENFVRIHRMGEGAPYTGISHEPIDSGVAADESIAQESLAPLEVGGFVTDENHEHVEEVFVDLLATKRVWPRRCRGRPCLYVENYVAFTTCLKKVTKKNMTLKAEEDHTASEETEGNWFTRLFSGGSN